MAAETPSTTLSARGNRLAETRHARALFQTLIDNPYSATTSPDGIINLSIAENNAMLPEVISYLSTHLDFSKELPTWNLSYGEGFWGSNRMRAALAGFMNRLLKPVEKIDARQVLIANGISTMLELVAWNIAEPGEGILMGQPIYQAFPWDIGAKAGVKAVHVPFGDADQFSPVAASYYEQALLKAEKEGVKVKALLLCHPHNPLARCYPQETLIELMKFCSKYKIHLISDEVYAGSVYEPPSFFRTERNGNHTDEFAPYFQSAIAFDSSQYIDKNYLHVLYGLSKDVGLSGLRVGVLYTVNEELWRAVSALNHFTWPGIATEKLSIKLLEDQDYLATFLAQNRKVLAERSNRAKHLLDEKGIKYAPDACAGVFLWADFRPYLKITGKEGWEAEAELRRRMLEDRKVMVNPGRMLSAEEPGWFRIITATKDDAELTEGMRRIFAALEV
ncbi:hypothetical protein M433DRAFT_152206 [Acidomyces richmondensis BFW]|nr:MAG: hypothetical protein FE78DRAFT_86933 [Acidomyces sp. 'richmondensis']KYG47511.1 hypothetical protein M433DRAFT_152206 [Acidomyces richmondensis BFW]